MAKFNNAALVSYAPHNGIIPGNGPQSISVELDVSTITSYDIELETALETGRLNFVQCLYIDTADAPAATITKITVGESNQRIWVKGGTQGYYPILCPSSKLTVATSATLAAPGLIRLQLLSMPMPAMAWATV